jgi:hypothetical protein
MTVLKFNGDIVSGDLDLQNSEMLCVPAKEHYNIVDIAFKNPGQSMNISVAEISASWLNYENKKVLGYEIEKRWNAAKQSEDLIASFNEALNFALDSKDAADGKLFLGMWREGDWDGIAAEFPEFDLSTTGQSNTQIA